MADTHSSIIIDDSSRDREGLMECLASHPDIAVIRECENAEDGLKAISEHAPSLVFLDVEMPGMNGIEMLARIPAQNRSFEVIFTTAYSRFAVQAFRMACMDFLTKPIQPDELIQALDKYRSQQDLEFRAKQQEVLEQQLKATKSRNSPMAIPTIKENSRHMDFIKVSDIVYCASAANTGAKGSYTTFYLDSGRTLDASKSIGHYVTLLQPYSFMQVHRGYIINPDYMSGYNGHEITMKVAEAEGMVPVSRGYKTVFEASLLK